MPLIYSATNLLDISTLDSVSTEDAVYTKDFLYDNRPSRPFRFTSRSAQWVKIHFPSATRITLVGCFNHNFEDGATVTIQANASDSWSSPSFSKTMTWREFDIYELLDESYAWWRFVVNDPTNPDMPQIGDLWIGNHTSFPASHVQPYREDPPFIFAIEQLTPYGQDWDAFLSGSKRFKISIVNVNDPAVVDEIETFIRSVNGPAGRWVFIPDSSQPHVYFVKIVGNPESARPVYGTRELREYSFDIKELTKGLTLL